MLLSWEDDGNPALAVWHIYSRGSTSESYLLRGSTTSSTFHDNGIPHLQYYVTAEDQAGVESGPSNVITVDERLALQKPTTLTTTSLNGAIALTWSDNAFASDPSAFKVYRVYSTPYDLDNDLCLDQWGLEGTTVAPEFVAGALPNGSPRCFGVSAISIEGFESLWSPIHQDTPRPDARNVVLYARQEQDDESGFRFWNDFNHDGVAQPNEIGVVGLGSSPSEDFSVERDASEALFITPVERAPRWRSMATHRSPTSPASTRRRSTVLGGPVWKPCRVGAMCLKWMAGMVSPGLARCASLTQARTSSS